MNTEIAALKAEKVIENPNKRHVYFDDSYIIYRGTNENINSEAYKESLYGKKDILSVIGSGDQVLNSILLECKNIDAYDISLFPKYYLRFKIGAIKALSYEEYLHFFYGDDTFSKDKFDKVMEEVDEDTRYFWIYLTRNRTPKELYGSKLFSGWEPTVEDAMFRNPYLASASNYYALRRKLDNPKINYIDGDIYNFSKTLEKDYDLVNLSNICMYAQDAFYGFDLLNALTGYKFFVKSLRINPSGKVLSYIINVDRNDSKVIADYSLNDIYFRNYYVPGNLDSRVDSVNIYKKVI